MGNPNIPNEHPVESLNTSNERSITIDGKNSTIGHISVELGIKMDWLKEFIGNYSARPKTYVTKNYSIPGKGEGKFKEIYWSEPRNGDKYIIKDNTDSNTGKTLIRIRGNEAMSIPVPPEAVPKKLSSIEEVHEDTHLQLAALMGDINSQTA